MKFLRALFLAVLLIASTQTSFAANKNHIRAEKATFVLYGRSASRGVEHKPLCTAFAYKKAPDGYYLLTAGHCFVNSHAPEDVQYFVVPGTIENVVPKGEAVEVLNAVDDGAMDVAELHLKTTNKYQILELDNVPTKIDDEVFYVGYPEMVGQVVYTGRVGSDMLHSATDPNDPCDICIGRFLVQTGGGPGASGSPIISERTGKVVGILEGHVFENGVVVVPATSIHVYYLKEGHSKPILKNEQSEGEVK